MTRHRYCLATEFPLHVGSATNSRIEGEQDLVSAVTRYLRSHLYQDISVSELAVLFGVAEGHLLYVFDANLGVSVTRYLLQERMFFAQRLLLQTSLSIEAIAGRTGFARSSHFSRTFRGYFGMTPWKFRRNPPDGAITAFQGSVLWG